MKFRWFFFNPNSVKPGQETRRRKKIVQVYYVSEWTLFWQTYAKLVSVYMLKKKKKKRRVNESVDQSNLHPFSHHAAVASCETAWDNNSVSFHQRAISTKYRTQSIWRPDVKLHTKHSTHLRGQTQRVLKSKSAYNLPTYTSEPLIPPSTTDLNQTVEISHQ